MRVSKSLTYSGQQTEKKRKGPVLHPGRHAGPRRHAGPLFVSTGGETLILATLVYIPLLGEMQNLLNLLCPLMEPILETRDGRTRGRMHDDVAISRIALVSTSGWWEIGNLDTVVRIACEIAEDASVPFVGSVLRPHASVMWQQEEKAREILDAAGKAGYQLATTGTMLSDTLTVISQPLTSEEEYRRGFNENYPKMKGKGH